MSEILGKVVVPNGVYGNWRVEDIEEERLNEKSRRGRDPRLVDSALRGQDRDLNAE